MVGSELSQCYADIAPLYNERPSWDESHRLSTSDLGDAERIAEVTEALEGMDAGDYLCLFFTHPRPAPDFVKVFRVETPRQAIVTEVEVGV